LASEIGHGQIAFEFPRLRRRRLLALVAGDNEGSVRTLEKLAMHYHCEGLPPGRSPRRVYCLTRVPDPRGLVFASGLNSGHIASSVLPGRGRISTIRRMIRNGDKPAKAVKPANAAASKTDAGRGAPAQRAGKAASKSAADAAFNVSTAEPVAAANPSKSLRKRLGRGVIAVAQASFRRERALIKRGIWPVAGCDEAGRGPLAGPVVAAAVVLDPKRVPKGLDDSKRLTAERREELFEQICATAQVSVVYASTTRINRDNILRASLWALTRAVHALPEMPAHVLVDGRDRLATRCECEAVIGGDGLIASIAAASIIAKVSRDRLMCKLAQQCPGYGFEQHKGYGVPHHLDALARLGPTIHHRRFFAPVAAAWDRIEGKPPMPIADLFDPPDGIALETSL
jgi:ribonuclease HII